MSDGRTERKKNGGKEGEARDREVKCGVHNSEAKRDGLALSNGSRLIEAVHGKQGRVVRA